MFERVLIANRGEIAVRVARTLNRLGVEAIAVYSDADAGARHVAAADRALRIGPTAAADSYLSVERILDAVERSGADAVHPGYGFLSERPEFSRACAAAGVTFVGPGPEAMALLGDKVAAKQAAIEAGVPVLPGLQRENLSDDEIRAWVADGGQLPILVKAAAGGGGKGMRVVGTEAELPEALAAARREAKAAFGDDRVLIEHFVASSRHIEVQVLADSHGQVIHLGERECSLQRRHQKVIEEAPSPVVDTELRERLGAAATSLAAAASYVNAGTVEFIAEKDDPSAFFFLEMNARLQVEHPVTELVTGLDLVELQLRVAAGEPLGLSQDEVSPRGHAIEARVYAEDTEHGFLPSTGRVLAYTEPTSDACNPEGDKRSGSVRVDSGIVRGSEVTPDYDPMLAKVIFHGDDRRAAIAGLDRALGDYTVLGPQTNIAYLRALLAAPDVITGAIDTELIERLGAEIAPPAAAPELAAVALALLIEPAGTDPWDAADGWRPAGPEWTRARLEGPAGEVAVEVRIAETDGNWDWRIDAESGTFGLDGNRLTVDGQSRALRVERESDAVWLLDGAAEPARFRLLYDDPGDREKASGGGSLEAPMPGVVLELRCAPGDEVAEGDVLVVMESMKMELAIQSPREGVVAELLAAVGDQVDRGRALVALVDEEEKG